MFIVSIGARGMAPQRGAMFRDGLEHRAPLGRHSSCTNGDYKHPPPPGAKALNWTLMPLWVATGAPVLA